MFKERAISGVILVIVAIVFIHFGGWLLLAGLCAISIIGMFELYRVLGIEKEAPAIIGYLATIVYFLNLRLEFIPNIMLLIMIMLICMMCAFVFKYPKYKANQIMGAFFGFFYVAVMLSCIWQTRMLVDGGRYLVWLIFLCSWGCDTCAYCVGMLIGKHKMAPVLSPKKSIEGAVGGVIGAAILAVIFGLIFHNPMDADGRMIALMAVICAAGALISMVGDLAASAIKRNYDIKDYGKLIPGHGGILDRFDSVIFTAPVIFFLTFYLI